MSEFWTTVLKPRVWIAKVLRPHPWTAKVLLVVFALVFLSLGLLGYLEPIKDFLDSEALSFQMGKVRFSVYVLMKAAITIVILFWLTGIFAAFGERHIKTIKGVKASNKVIMVKIFQIFVYFVAFMVGLDVLGIDLTTLAIFSGAVGIGIGFGLQKITSNFISGLILLFEKSVENDDLVELSDGVSGFIRHTGARYTLVESFDGKEIMIPNEDFITNRVTNWTYSNSKGRIAIEVGVSYDSDMEQVMALILEAAQNHPRCIDNPPPACFLCEFGASAVNFLLLFWVADVTDGRQAPRSDVMFSIWKKFKENHIMIPYPQQDLYIKNLETLK